MGRRSTYGSFPSVPDAQDLVPCREHKRSWVFGALH